MSEGYENGPNAKSAICIAISPDDQYLRDY